MTIKKTITAVFACLAVGSSLAAEVKVATVTGFTGPNAATSEEGAIVAKGYIAMINDKGGVHGNKLVVVTKDDQYDPRKTVEMVNEAITQDNVVALMNGSGTANTGALIKSGILNKYKVPLVGVFSGSELIRGPGSEQIFHTRASYGEEVMKIARLLPTIGLNKVAVLYQDDGFGASINDGIAKAAQEFKFTVVAKSAYKPGETDFTKHAKELIAARPQAILLMGVPDAVNRFMKAYDAPVGASQIYTLSYVQPQGLVSFAGERRVRGMGITQVVPNPNSVSLPLAKEFQAFLKSPYGKGATSDPINFEIYLNTRLLVEAIKLAGPNPTPEKVTQALTTMHNYRLGGYPIDFTETNRRGSSYLDIGVIGYNGRLSY